MAKIHRRSPAIHMWLALLAVSIAGCARTPEDQPQSPGVDPRFATAAALLEHYNSITTAEPVDLIAAYDLCHGENDFQRRYINASRKLMPFAKLDRLMFERFGECFDPRRKAHLLAPDQPATMTREDGERAEATFVDSLGESKTLHLVRIGDRWWVSGFTFEYESHGQQSKAEIDSLERLGERLVAVAPGVIEAIENGEVTTASQARDLVRDRMRILSGNQ